MIKIELLLYLAFTLLGAIIYRNGFFDGQKAKNGEETKSIIKTITSIPKTIKENKLQKEAIEQAMKEESEWNKLLNYTGDEDENNQ